MLRKGNISGHSMYRDMTCKLNILSGKEGHAECVMDTMEDVEKYVSSEVMPRLKK